MGRHADREGERLPWFSTHSVICPCSLASLYWYFLKFPSCFSSFESAFEMLFCDFVEILGWFLAY